jgi:hypothetical protein
MIGWSDIDIHVFQAVHCELQGPPWPALQRHVDRWHAWNRGGVVEKRGFESVTGIQDIRDRQCLHDKRDGVEDVGNEGKSTIKGGEVGGLMKMGIASKDNISETTSET